MDEGEAAGEVLRGQAQIWQLMLAFADSMALKCAVELRIADILHSHGEPITLSQIASHITDSPSPNISFLARVMRLLVRKNIFTAHDQSSNGGSETLYGPTPSSKWLVRDSKLSLAPFVVLENHPWQLAPWHYLSQCVKDGESAFKKAHGCEFWEFASANPEYNKLFTHAMSCTVNILMEAFLPAYKDGFGCIGSLVDVGGRTGGDINMIVKSHPHIKGINFDLPDVVAAAPIYDGVSHIGGNMFQSIPNADAVFIKDVLFNWNDEECVKILKNCRKAIPKDIGKIIIIDTILELDNNDIFEETRIVMDLAMMTCCTGKERTETEWKKLLVEGGFPRYKITKIPALQCIIEGYPV